MTAVADHHNAGREGEERVTMKLLLIEDDKKISTVIKRGLEAEGYTVDVAFEGGDGLWMATEGSYDLIVLDIMLPGRNGYQICADLRGAGDWTPSRRSATEANPAAVASALTAATRCLRRSSATIAS